MEDHLNSNVVADPDVMQLESDRIQLAMSSASEGLTDLESTGLLGDIRKMTTHDPPTTDGTKKHNSISRKGINFQVFGFFDSSGDSIYSKA